jgi:hypothetical protein
LPQQNDLPPLTAVHPSTSTKTKQSCSLNLTWAPTYHFGTLHSASFASQEPRQMPSLQTHFHNDVSGSVILDNAAATIRINTPPHSPTLSPVRMHCSQSLDQLTLIGELTHTYFRDKTIPKQAQMNVLSSMQATLCSNSTHYNDSIFFLFIPRQGT